MKAGCCFLISAAVVLLWSHAALAQAQNNFFSPTGVGLYNPIIDVVADGSRLVVAPVVSADRKYVTLSMNPQVSRVVAIQTFQVSGITGLGTVGGAMPAAASPRVAPPNMNGSAPVRVNIASSGKNVLNTPGMTWVAPP